MLLYNMCDLYAAMDGFLGLEVVYCHLFHTSYNIYLISNSYIRHQELLALYPHLME